MSGRRLDIARAVDALLDALQLEYPEWREAIARAGVRVEMANGAFLQVRAAAARRPLPARPAGPRVVVGSNVARDE